MCLHYTLHGDYNAYLVHSIVIVCSNTDSKHQSLIATSLWWLEGNMEKDTDSMASDDKGEDNPAFVAEDSEEAKDISKISKHYEQQVEKGLEEEPERQQWSNPIEFLLSCIAMSVS